MERLEFIQEMKNQVENLKKERAKVKKTLVKNFNSETDHKYVKLGYEISTLENAIREFEYA